MWLFADLVTNAMFLTGVVLLLVILLRRSFRYYGRRRPAKSSDKFLAEVPRPGPKQRSLSSAPPEVLGWHVEMHETARELKAELDSKMRTLQLLIGQARQESERLESLLTKRDASGPDSSRVSDV